MKKRIRELVLDVLHEGEPMHPYGVHREIRERYHRTVAYSTCRRILGELLGEGRVRRLSGKEIQDLGLQVNPSPSGRSGWRPPLSRNYYRINE